MQIPASGAGKGSKQYSSETALLSDSPSPGTIAYAQDKGTLWYFNSIEWVPVTDTTVLDGYQRQINSLYSAADGYQIHLSEIDAFNSSVRVALDGYLTSDDDSAYETIVNHNADMVIIRAACDGYGTPPDLSPYETKIAHGLDIKALTDASDGYQTQIDNIATQLEPQFVAIGSACDGYVPYVGAISDVSLGANLKVDGYVGIGISPSTLTKIYSNVLSTDTSGMIVNVPTGQTANILDVRVNNVNKLRFFSNGASTYFQISGNTVNNLLKIYPTDTSHTYATIIDGSGNGFIFQVGNPGNYNGFGIQSVDSTTTKFTGLYNYSSGKNGHLAFIGTTYGSADGGNIYFRGGNSAGSVKGLIKFQSPDGVSDFMTILPTGNIGIQTASPSVALHVNGDGYFNGLVVGDLSVNSDGYFTGLTVGDLTVNGQAGSGITTLTPTGTTLTINWNQGNSQVIDLSQTTGNLVVTLTNPRPGYTYMLKIKQRSSSPRTVTFSPVPKWPAGLALVVSTAANAEDIVSLFYDGTYYYANYGQGYA